MSKLWPAEIAVKALQEEGVEVMFGLMGGHIQPIQDHAYRAGIKVIQVRHEQAAAYAADGYARATGRPSVCFGTAGPGMLNMVAAIHMAFVSRTPMVCLFGGHKELESHRGTMQEAYAADVCRSITKWTIRVTEPELTGHFIRKAFRDAMTPPYGPVGIEFPIDKFNWEPVEEAQQIAWKPGPWLSHAPSRPATDPVDAQAAVKMLIEAERPLLLGGEDLHWSASSELLERFVDRLSIPFNFRRLGRGALPETHPLAINGGARRDLLADADVVLVAGLRMGYLESFGEWKSGAKYIQLQSHASDILPTLPTEYALVGDAGMIMQQMLDAAGNAVTPPRENWLRRARDLQAGFLAKLDGEADEHRADQPIHPRWLAKVVSDAVTPETTIVFDSFTASTYLGERFQAQRSGQVQDAGLSAAFGHGVGMAIGAQLARPEHPVLAIMGDGGIGLGGGDIETAVRYNLPVVYLIYNDSTYCAGLEQYCYGDDFRVLGPDAVNGFRLTQDVRYDLMYAPLGCHVEHVTDPSEIGAAIKRAFASGRTAVINLEGTRHVRHPLYDSANAREMFWHLPASEVEEPARKRHHEQLYPRFHGGALLDR